jgi:hypothetical protein
MSRIDRANAYSAFYKWFEYLPTIQAKLLGYVIMPNHFHGIIYLDEDCPRSINLIVSNAKRFIAYDIINNLEESKQESTLQDLFHSTTDRENDKGQKHKVFKASFDAKELLSTAMLTTKLDYMHRNHCQGKSMLVDDFTKFEHSSAGYYELGDSNNWLTDYREIYG